MRLRLVHKLFYSWNGWPASCDFPAILNAANWDQIDAEWKRDGLKRVSQKWVNNHIQITFLAQPDVSPQVIAARAKGRLRFLLKKSGWTGEFRRKVAVRSIGMNRRATVSAYIADQLKRSTLIDPGYVKTLANGSWENPNANPLDPLASKHGRYWYNLHTVIVTNDRWRLNDAGLIVRLKEELLDWGVSITGQPDIKAKCSRIHSLSFMPDHLHLAFRGPVDRSPMNLGQELYCRVNQAAGFQLYSDNIYMGTYSEYTLGAVLKREDGP